MSLFLKKIIPRASFLLLLITFIVIACNAWIRTFRDKCYTNLEDLPENKTALVLGTSKYVRGGYKNQYYKHRIEAAHMLFTHGKVTHFIVSGDNSTKQYNEPITMKNDLVALGIPEKNIYVDYAGFRTLDSVERAKEIFGQDTIIIVSQPFHNERAIAIAQSKGIYAYGFNAKSVSSQYGLKTNVRELFARVKTVLDLTVLQTKAKFHGDKIIIEK